MGSYQGVKSQIKEKFHIPLEDGNDVVGGSLLSSLSNTVKWTEPKDLPRRILFPNGVQHDDKNEDDLKLCFDYPSTSSNEANGVLSDEPKLPVEGVSSVENDEFWKQQLISLQMAADNTRELFQTGLNDPGSEIQDFNFDNFLSSLWS